MVYNEIILYSGIDIYVRFTLYHRRVERVNRRQNVVLSHAFSAEQYIDKSRMTNRNDGNGRMVVMRG